MVVFTLVLGDNECFAVSFKSLQCDCQWFSLREGLGVQR